jgi:hypothetical protein
MNDVSRVVAERNRFKFGENWNRFRAILDGDRIKEAKKLLKQMLKTETLGGKLFLDIGWRSRLFSLTAKRLDLHSLI